MAMICPHCGKDVYRRNHERNDKIVAAVEAGATQVSQAKKFNLSQTTIANIWWRSQCKPGETVYQCKVRVYGSPRGGI